LPEDSDVRVGIYNLLGEEIVEIINSKYTAGNHIIIFEANDLSSGIYIYRLIAGEFIKSKMMVLIK